MLLIRTSEVLSFVPDRSPNRGRLLTSQGFNMVFSIAQTTYFNKNIEIIGRTGLCRALNLYVNKHNNDASEEINQQGNNHHVQ